MKTFKDPSAAIRHFKSLNEKVAQANSIGLRDAAEMLEHETKEQIGCYLVGSTGPFDPTAELATATKEERLALGWTENDPGYRSGSMQESYGARVDGPSLLCRASVGSDDLRALWFEMGTKREGNEHQPARSELGIAAFRHGHEASEIVGRMVARAMEGKPPPNRPSGQEARDPLDGDG